MPPHPERVRAFAYGCAIALNEDESARKRRMAADQRQAREQARTAEAYE